MRRGGGGEMEGKERDWVKLGERREGGTSRRV